MRTVRSGLVATARVVACRFMIGSGASPVGPFIFYCVANTIYPMLLSIDRDQTKRVVKYLFTVPFNQESNRC